MNSIKRRRPPLTTTTLISVAILSCWAAIPDSLCGQTIIYQEGFNDDGHGTRYTLDGRGQVVDGPDGLAIWNHSFDVNDFGRSSPAPAKRAAMLFGHDVADDLWTDPALEILDNLVNWALDDKPNANIYFLPLGFGSSSQLLFDRLVAQGHNVSDLDLGVGIPGNADLVFNTSEERPDPLSLFVGADVPLISFNARGHDSALVVTRGASTRFQEAVAVNVNEENREHPILGGHSGTIEWTFDAPSSSVRGLGPRVAPGAKLLATYEDPVSGEPLPALVIVEEGDELLGGFDPGNVEGEGFIVGADLNLDFGGFPSSDERPKTLELFPVDVSDAVDVQLTVSLAASDFDVDANDFLRVMIDANNSGNFETLSEFRGNERYIFDDGNVELTADSFIDVTWDIPDDATNLVVRFEAHSTFPNEQIGIDNIRITTVGIPGDFNGNGMLDSEDADALIEEIINGQNQARFDQNADSVVDSRDLRIWVKDVAFTWFGDANLDGEFNSGDLVSVFQAGKFEQGVDATWSEGDWNGDQRFDSGDFVVAFQDGGFELGPRTTVNTVPEPSSTILLIFGGLGIFNRRRSL